MEKPYPSTLTHVLSDTDKAHVERDHRVYALDRLLVPHAPLVPEAYDQYSRADTLTFWDLFYLSDEQREFHRVLKLEYIAVQNEQSEQELTRPLHRLSRPETEVMARAAQNWLQNFPEDEIDPQERELMALAVSSRTGCLILQDYYLERDRLHDQPRRRRRSGYDQLMEDTLRSHRLLCRVHVRALHALRLPVRKCSLPPEGT